MDTLRSCYVTTMRDGHGTLFRARWYFTDAQPLDKEHVYGSHNHIREQGDEDYDTGEPGEVWGASRQWVDGSAPVDCACTGTAGSDNAWIGEPEPGAPLFAGCLFAEQFDASYSEAFASETWMNGRQDWAQE